MHLVVVHGGACCMMVVVVVVVKRRHEDGHVDGGCEGGEVGGGADLLQHGHVLLLRAEEDPLLGVVVGDKVDEPVAEVADAVVHEEGAGGGGVGGGRKCDRSLSMRPVARSARTDGTSRTTTHADGTRAHVDDTRDGHAEMGDRDGGGRGVV